jgi:hypothetical protein
MEAAASSDARSCIPEEGDISTHRRENLKYILFSTFWCFGTPKMIQTGNSEVMKIILYVLKVTDFYKRSHFDKIDKITFSPHVMFNMNKIRSCPAICCALI